MALDMADATPRSHYVEIANAGHLPTVESPRDVTAALKGFLGKL